MIETTIPKLLTLISKMKKVKATTKSAKYAFAEGSLEVQSWVQFVFSIYNLTAYVDQAPFELHFLS